MKTKQQIIRETLLKLKEKGLLNVPKIKRSLKEVSFYNRFADDAEIVPYKLGDGYSNNFDYNGMLAYAKRVSVRTPISKLQKLFDSYEDVNYHTASEPLWDAIQQLKSGDIEGAAINIKEFKKRSYNEVNRLSESVSKKKLKEGTWIDPTTNKFKINGRKALRELINWKFRYQDDVLGDDDLLDGLNTVQKRLKELLEIK